MSLEANDLKNDPQVKDDEWEVVSGSRSLTQPSLGEKKQTSEDLEEKRSLPKVSLNGNEDSSDSKKTESDVWYKTIPATPANTPEYTPTPPPYPASTRKSEDQNVLEGDDLPTIKEDPKEEQNELHSGAEDEDSEDAEEIGIPQMDVSELQNAFKALGLGLCRLALIVVAVSVLKWSLVRVWGKIKTLQAKGQTEK